MTRLGTNSGRLWRQIASCIAVYALVLQSLVAGLDGSRVVALAPAGDELCLHAVDDGLAPPPPSDHAGDKSHCPFCLTGGHQAPPVPAPAPHFVAAVAARISWLSDARDHCDASGCFSHSPRRPPIRT